MTITVRMTVEIECDGLCGKHQRFVCLTEGNCYYQARQQGWKMRPSRRKAICPSCVKAGIKLPV